MQAAGDIDGAATVRLADIDVSPAIIAQIDQEPEEAYWFVWDRGMDGPWRGRRTKLIRAFAFESDAAAWAAEFNGTASDIGLILDGYPRQATVKEAKAARTDGDYPVGLFDRDGNLHKVIG